VELEEVFVSSGQVELEEVFVSWGQVELEEVLVSSGQVELEEVFVSSGQVELEEIFVSWASIFFRSNGTWLFKAQMLIYVPPALSVKYLTFRQQIVVMCFFMVLITNRNYLAIRNSRIFFITETECFLRGTNWSVKYNSGYI